METILWHFLLSAAPDIFATSSSPFYLTTALKNHEQAFDFNDEAAFSFGIGTMASDSLIVEPSLQTNELSESLMVMTSAMSPLGYEVEVVSFTLGLELLHKLGRRHRR